MTRSNEERETWIERTREGIERWGSAEYLSSPLIEATESFFPDRYTRDLRGVRTVARRLARYAKLDTLYVDVVGPCEFDSDPLAETWILLSGVDDEAIVFRAGMVGRDEDVALALAHEVARGYRLLRDRAKRKASEHPYRRSAAKSAAARSRKTDDEDDALAAVHLGFGLLVTLGTHQYRATGGMQGTQTVTRWVHRHLGGLGPEVASFLLALQVTVRGLDEAAIEALAARLAADERAEFLRAARELRGRRDALCDALGLPPRAEWPAPSSEPVVPLDDDGWEPEEEDEVAEPLENEGRPVFRRAQFQARLFGMIGFAVGLAVILVALLAAPGTGVWSLLAAVGLTAAGIGIGSNIRAQDVCSDRSCEAALPREAATCPRCGGTIRGEIGASEPHLYAVERLEGTTMFGEEAEPAERDDADPRYVELGVACPSCAWIPDGRRRWQCDECARLFDTFETRARCPGCGRTFEETWCPECHQASPHAYWWPADETEPEP